MPASVFFPDLQRVFLQRNTHNRPHPQGGENEGAGYANQNLVSVFLKKKKKEIANRLWNIFLFTPPQKKLTRQARNFPVKTQKERETEPRKGTF